MNIRLLFSAFILLLGVSTANAQEPFLPRITPHLLKLDSSSGRFTVTVNVQLGFTADVYLSVTAPTLPGATVSIAPARIRQPYTDSAVITFLMTGIKTAGRHPIIVKAENGPAIKLDTAYIQITDDYSAWRVYNSTNSPLTGYSLFTLDRKNGVGWFATREKLLSFDGATWTQYNWPYDSTIIPRIFSIRGLAIDSSGDIWAAFEGYEGMVVRKHGNSWTMFDGHDTSSGITPQMLNGLHYTMSYYDKVQADSNGNVWVLGGSTLLRYFNNRWSIYSAANSHLVSMEYYVYLVDHAGNVWLNFKNGGVLKFDGTYWSEFSIADLGLTDPTALTFPVSVDRDNHLWMARRGSQPIVEFDGVNVMTYGSESWLGKGVPKFDVANRPWVAASKQGIVRYYDSSWWQYTIANSGLPSNDITTFDIDDNEMVWMVTSDGSLTLLDGSIPPQRAFTSGIRSEHSAATGNASMKISPNPARGISTVSFLLPEREHLRLSVINSLGKEVDMMIDGVMEPGEHAARFDASALPGGAYFVRIATGTAVVTKPLVIVH